MAADVDICNAALIKLGGETITSLGQTGSKSARLCANAYPRLRDKLQRDYDWHFCKERAELARLSNAPIAEYDYAYQLPTGFLRLLEVHVDTESQIPIRRYRLMGQNRLETDETKVFIVYQQQITDVNAMDPSFRDALSSLIAHDIALALTQSKSVKEQMGADFEDSIIAAIGVGAIEDRDEIIPDGDWVTSRYR